MAGDGGDSPAAFPVFSTTPVNTCSINRVPVVTEWFVWEGTLCLQVEWGVPAIPGCINYQEGLQGSCGQHVPSSAVQDLLDCPIFFRTSVGEEIRNCHQWSQVWVEENLSRFTGYSDEKRLITERGTVSPRVGEDCIEGTIAKQKREQYSQLK